MNDRIEVEPTLLLRNMKSLTCAFGPDGVRTGEKVDYDPIFSYLELSRFFSGKMFQVYEE